MRPRMRFPAFAIMLCACAVLSRTVAAQQGPIPDDPDFVLDLQPLEKPAPATPQPDPALQRLVGRVYEGHLSLDGWEDLGGGLLAQPVWFHHYRRADGVQLVLIDWAQPRRPGAQQATFRVTDVLLTPPLQNGLSLAFNCRQSRRNVTQKIIAVIRADRQHASEWWRDVKLAWSVSLDDGRITPISPAGIECANEGWGE
jgi:hypothetical protein